MSGQTARLADACYITPDIAIGALNAWAVMGGYGNRRPKEELAKLCETSFRDAVKAGTVVLIRYPLWAPIPPNNALEGDQFAKDAYITVQALHEWLSSFAPDAGTFTWQEWWALMEANRWYEWATASDTTTAPAEAGTVNRKGPGRPGLPKVTHELACRLAETEYRRTGKCPSRTRMITLLSQETGRSESTISGKYQHNPVVEHIKSRAS